MELLSPSTPLISLPGAAIDSETTGLDPSHARIVQLAALRVNGMILDTGHPFETLVNPGVPIPKKSTDVHGVSDRDVASAHSFHKVWEDFDAFAGPRVFIGYRTGYDISVLKRECVLAGLEWPDRYWICVQALARFLSSQQLAVESLESLADNYGVTIRNRHSALGDAEAAAEIWLAMIPALRQKGIRTLGEVLTAVSVTSHDGGENLAHEPAGVEADVSALKDHALPLRIDGYAYRNRLRDVMSAPAIFAPPEMTMQDAARLLIDKGVSSVLVQDRGPTGIVTERDVLRGVATDTPDGQHLRLRDIMSAPLHTLPDDTHLYAAMARMNRLGIRHLTVTGADGGIAGMVTPRNLLRARANEALSLGDGLERAQSGADLAGARAKLPMLAAGLLADDLDARSVCAVISAELCNLTRRAAEIAEKRLKNAGFGDPPVPYAVMVLGSGGRGESLLAPDQDNAIIYESGEPGGPEDQWFEQLGGHIADILDEAGVPYCQSGVMGRNAAWRQSVEHWKATIDGWVEKSRPEDLTNVDIFFDSIGVHGDTVLADQIWLYAYQRAHKAPAFQALLTEMARNRNSPFGVFGGFRGDKDDRVDLKGGGLMPIFTSARVLSIKHQRPARPTADRLNALSEAGIFSQDNAERILSAQETILDAMLRQQLADGLAGIPLSNRVDTNALTAKQRSDLRGAIREIDIIVDIISEARF